MVTVPTAPNFAVTPEQSATASVPPGYRIISVPLQTLLQQLADHKAQDQDNSTAT